MRLIWHSLEFLNEHSIFRRTGGFNDSLSIILYLAGAMTDSQTKRSAGRPRTFDANAALDKAVRLFWQRGYEATSMSDLVAELGVGAASLYAAFGNKAGLFEAVVERYASTFSVALYAPVNDPGLSTYDAVKGLLTRAAATFSEPDTPAGCFMYSAAAAVSPASASIERLLRDRRIEAEGVLAARLEGGIVQGDLSEEANPATLAKFINAIMEGMSVQARDGATKDELLAIARMALDRWPEKRDRAP
jgi:AcrR family transcriptional regulator